MDLASTFPYPDDVAGKPTKFGRRLKQLRTEMGWSQPRLAKASGISNGYIGGLESGIVQGNPSRDFVLRIAQAFDIPAYELLELAGRLEPSDRPGARPRQTFRQVVMGDPKLRSDERDALLNLYTTFTKGRR